ncbi:MAG: hypothetical protein ACT4OF_12370 [Caulobacteraceae bacterium]
MKVVPRAHAQASLVAPKAVSALPIFRGNSDTSQVCGSCGVTLIEGMTNQDCVKEFAAPFQLLVQCPAGGCGAFNVIPATLGVFENR